MENLKFYDDEHERFYKEHTENKKLDCYNRSMIYLLGLTKETRNNFDTIYDDVSKEIKFTALNEGWQTGTSNAVCKLAFNLFNGYCGLQDRDAKQYTIENIFAYKGLAEYFFEGIRIRFEIM